jgi:hypothetical protein
MTLTNNEQFYSRLPVNDIPLGELLVEEHLFYRIPGNWHIVITDVEKSTAAVKTGLHENVNLVATGSMVAVLNIAYKAGIIVPAFFGGDGASFIIPPSLVPATVRALNMHRDNTLQQFNLNLRVGYLPVSAIYEKDHSLTISKLRTSKSFFIPVVLGSGLDHAEKIFKAPGYAPSMVSVTSEELDLSGMQCRWDKIEPPIQDDEVLSLLVIARDSTKQNLAFKQVIDHLDEIYGGQEKRKPISVMRLRLKGTIRQLALEMRAKFRKYQPFYLAKVWMTSLLAPYYFKTKKGRHYLDQLVEMSDNLVIDGRINTVISGNAAQRKKLIAALDMLEEEGSILFGFHISDESVLSCYVRSLEENHIHFVDGAGGGYTQAAAMLKKKLPASLDIATSF